jgi:hypothetical protein
VEPEHPDKLCDQEVMTPDLDYNDFNHFNPYVHERIRPRMAPMTKAHARSLAEKKSS